MTNLATLIWLEANYHAYIIGIPKSWGTKPPSRLQWLQWLHPMNWDT